MNKTIGTLILSCVALAGSLSAQPVRIDPGNPHYYSFHGRPTLLITSAEHYGAVLNAGFDYVAYLDALRANGLNYTRIYPGYLFEPVGKYLTGNSLGPRPSRLILPWARSEKPGYMLGGNLFDLNRWDDAYFTRLRDFLRKADERGVVVEICFFNSQYSDTWAISPLYYENNVQGEGNCDWRDAQSLKHADLVRREEDYVRKITQEANAFDNVILEICDEAASIGTGITLAGPWVAHMADVVIATEKNLPKKHLIAQEVEGPFGGAMDFSADPRFDIVVGQYINGWIAGEAGGEMGGIRGLDVKYGVNKPIELNETDYYPLNYRGDKIADSRVEAWEFIVGGGAGFNQLNGLFTVANPAGKHPDDEKMFAALRHLSEFMTSFEFTKMHPDSSFVLSGPGKGTYARMLSEAGRQYAFYVHHSSERKTGSYEVVPGSYSESLQLDLPSGSYHADWVDPASGNVVASQNIAHSGGRYGLTAPQYTIDIALRIKRK
jgi:hypothetical protein